MFISNEIYIASLLALGDAITIKPLVKLWCSQYRKLYYATNPENIVSVSALFADLPMVIIVPYTSAEDEQQFINQHNLPVLNLRNIVARTPVVYHGYDQRIEIAINYDRQLYEYFEVPYSWRHKGWHANFDLDAAQRLYDMLNPTHEPYVLWHKSMSYYPQGVPIDLSSYRQNLGKTDIKIIDILPEHTQNILDYYLLIQRAQEIHCVPSSFHALVDSLIPHTKAELYYHDIKHNSLLQVNCWSNKFRWNAVYYAHKV